MTEKAVRVTGGGAERSAYGDRGGEIGGGELLVGVETAVGETLSGDGEGEK